MTTDLRNLLVPWVGVRPRTGRPSNVTEVVHRLAASIDYRGDDECWEWMASRGVKGYGRVRVNGRTRTVHRVVYELLVGRIPAGLQLDHLCRNPACCNPLHLEPVTNHENALRGVRANQTHCINGHPYDEINTYWCHWAPTQRKCRACTNARDRARRAVG